MPTVHREGPFRFFMWPNDHSPPHVHVFNSDGRCVIELGTGYVRRSATMREHDIAAASRIATQNSGKLLTAWRKIHGF